MSDVSYANQYDEALKDVLAEREVDWRNGALVYQVLVDRFAPAANLDEKKHLYASPKTLKTWDELPRRGTHLDDVGLWTHEIEFWGGDLSSLRGKIDYIHDLGMDVLYLNPIHKGFTNHKYDALDYQQVSAEFGTRDDVVTLAAELHKKGMKIVLDGVFNHMGRNSHIFQDALNNPDSEYREWFYFGDEYPGGYRAWATALNLPELNLENKAVRNHIYAKKDSVVQSYLAQGIDGWRLDVAYDIGFKYLAKLTEAAHKRKPGSLVVGELWNYPKEWFPAVDGVMNFTAREIIWRTCSGELDPHTAAHMLEKMIKDAGIDNMLTSWLVLDNHDTPRLKNMLPETWQQRMAQVLQFSLPGSPNVYYGVELGMSGGEDPEMRAPMRWDWVNENNETLAWTKKLIAIRRASRALKIGNFRNVVSSKLLAYERYTDRVSETVIIVANPHKKKVRELLMISNSKLMNWGELRNLLDTQQKPIHLHSGLATVELGPGEVMLLVPETAENNGYTPYKRVQ